MRYFMLKNLLNNFMVLWKSANEFIARKDLRKEQLDLQVTCCNYKFWSIRIDTVLNSGM